MSEYDTDKLVTMKRAQAVKCCTGCISEFLYRVGAEKRPDQPAKPGGLRDGSTPTCDEFVEALLDEWKKGSQDITAPLSVFVEFGILKGDPDNPRWIVSVMGSPDLREDGSVSNEVSVVLDNNIHGQRSYGWEDASKIVVGRNIRQECWRFFLDTANALADNMNKETIPNIGPNYGIWC